jgi:hypothetical protein
MYSPEIQYLSDEYRQKELCYVVQKSNGLGLQYSAWNGQLHLFQFRGSPLQKLFFLYKTFTTAHCLNCSTQVHNEVVECTAPSGNPSRVFIQTETKINF